MKDNWGAFFREDVVLNPLGSGRLNGLSFAVKDAIDVQGFVTGAGNPDWLRTHHAANRTAVSIDQLLQHGARLVGKTHTDELMFSLNGENAHYGTPVNPRDSSRIPGGSSSGSAVAVAAGLVDFALGTDTAGSVRIPASYCGVYGFRPTHGAVSTEGVIPLANSFDTVAWMANHTGVLLDVGLSLLDREMSETADFSRMCVAKDVLALADPACRDGLMKWIHRLEDRVRSCEWVEIAKEGLPRWQQAFRILQGLEIWNNHGEWIQTEHPTFGPGLAERFAWTGTLQESDGIAAGSMRNEIRNRLSDLLGSDGFILLPTSPGVAPLLNMRGNDLESRRQISLQMTCIASLTGLPQVTLPWGEVDGLPVGLSIIAGPGQDIRLLQWIQRAAEDLGIQRVENFDGIEG